MPFIGGMVLPYANPLDVSDVSDSEQYQGCRMLSVGVEVLETYKRINQLERSLSLVEAENAALRNEIAFRDLAEQRETFERNSSLGNSVGLPTEDKARKRLQIWTWLMEYFPDAILALVEVSIRGNEQHNPGEPLHWARGKSMDQMNTAFRHQWDYGRGVKKDTDGQYHLGKAAWRLLAQLQLDIEEERRQNGDK
jgi:hypothetical protein